MQYDIDMVATVANDVFPEFLEKLGKEIVGYADTTIVGTYFSLVVWKRPTQWTMDQTILVAGGLPKNIDGEDNYLLQIREGGEMVEIYGLPDLNVYDVSIETTHTLAFKKEEW